MEKDTISIPKNVSDFGKELKSLRESRDRFVEEAIRSEWTGISPAYFCRKGVSIHDAQDLYQNFLQKVLQNISQFSGNSQEEFLGWNYSIADHEFCRFLQQKQRKEKELPEQMEVEAKQDRKEEDKEELKEWVHAFEAALPPTNKAGLSPEKAMALFLQILGYSEQETLALINNRCTVKEHNCLSRFKEWKRAKLAVTRYRARTEVMNHIKGFGLMNMGEEYSGKLYEGLRTRACSYLAVLWCNLELPGQKGDENEH